MAGAEEEAVAEEAGAGAEPADFKLVTSCIVTSLVAHPEQRQGEVSPRY